MATPSKTLFKKHLYHAMQNNNVERFIETVRKHYEISDSDEALSEFYDEVRLKGTQLPSKLIEFIEERLIRARLFEKAEKQQQNFSKVLERVDFLIFLIDELNKNKETPDGVFVFISRTIAANIHILKKQLKFSYNVLPWEEIEFCLVIYIASKFKCDPITESILNQERILNHVNNFRNALCSEKPKLQDSKTKFNNRVAITKNILLIYPQFELLYKDYEILRDMYSLRRMKKYLHLVLSINENDKTIQKLAIERTLQVIGENLKNTPESPNLSAEIEKRLLNSAPKHLKKILTSLRNMLSHSAALEKKILYGENHEDIINDLKKVYVEIVTILNEYVQKICAENGVHVETQTEDFDLFSTKEFRKLDDIISKLRLMHPEDIPIYKKFQNTIHEKFLRIQRPQNKFDMEYAIRSNWSATGLLQIEKPDKPLRDFLKSCQKLKGNSHELRLMVTDALDASMYDLKKIKDIWDYKDNLESNDGNERNAEEKVDRICEKIEEILKDKKEKQRFYKKIEELKKLHFAKDKILNDKFRSCNEYRELTKIFPSKVVKTLEQLSPENDLKKIKSVVKVVNDAYGTLLQNVGSNNIMSLTNYRELLNKFCATLKLKKNEIVNHLVDEFKKQIDTYFDSRAIKLNEIISINQISTELQLLAVEMLLLDLLEILMNTYNFTDNTSYLDRPAPLLVGKNLRNYLAHGNPLIDTLPFDPYRSIEIHSKLFNEKCLNFQEGVDYGHTINFTVNNAKENYHKRFAIIANQSAMFEAARHGNMKKVEECVRENADPQAFDINGENGLQCAAKGNNVELLMYFLNENVDAKVVDILETAVKHSCERIVEYLFENHSSAAKYIRGDNRLLHLAVWNERKSMTKLLLNLGCKPNVIKSGVSPLYAAAELGLDVIVDILLSEGASVLFEDDDGNQPLHAAAISGSWKCAEKLLENGAQINLTNHKGYTSLHVAAERGHAEFVNNLLQNGARHDLKTEEGFSALFLATCNGDTETAKVLLEHKALVGIKTKESLTPLHAAAFFGHTNLIELLLRKGASILSLDLNCWTPLHFAASRGRSDSIKLVFKPGLKTNTSCTPLHLAAHCGSNETVKLLLACEGEVINEKDIFGCTALHVAAFRGYADVVETLLEANAKIDTLNKERWTAFLMAAAEGHYEVIGQFLLKCHIPQQELDYGLYLATEFEHELIVKLLLKAGGNPNFEVKTISELLEKEPAFLRLMSSECEHILPMRTGTCLHTAAIKGNVNIFKMLLENGADVNAKDKDVCKKMTDGDEITYTFGDYLGALKTSDDILLNSYHCLHFASIQGHTEIVEILLDNNNVDKNTKDLNGLTALHHATYRDHKHTVQVLLRAGADPNATDSNGLTALHNVTLLGFVRIAQLLIRHNANIHAKANDNVSILQIATGTLKTAMLEMLLECDFNFEERYTAFQSSIICGKTKAVEVFLNNMNTTADYSVSLFDFFPPLHNAVHCEIEDVTEILLKHNFDVNQKFSSHKTTPLHLAVDKRNINLTKILLKNGADVNAATATGSTPLILAIVKNHTEIVRLLLEYGADVTKGNSYGTPLHYAIPKNNFMVITLILDQLIRNCDDKKTYLNAKNSYGGTSLLLAIVKKQFKTARTLIDQGADVNRQNDLGMSCLHWAVQVQSFELVQLLIENGIDVTLKNKENKTALDIALENCSNGDDDENMTTIAAVLMSCI